MRNFIKCVSHTLLALLLSVSLVHGQQVKNHAVPVGKGSGTGFRAVGPCALGSVPAGNGASLDPTCQTILSILPLGVLNNVLNTYIIDHTVLTTECGKLVQMGTGTTGLKTLTVPAVAGFDPNCIVRVINGDTGRAKKVVGLTGITWIMPLQAVDIQIVNGAWAVTNMPPMWAPTGAITVFADDTNGNAANDCLAAGAGNACTTASVMAFISANIFNINGITIQWANAATGPFLAGRYAGPGSITLDGNTNTMTAGGSACACVIAIGSASQASPSVNGVWFIRRFTIANSVSGVYGIFCQTQVNCIVQDGMTEGTLTGGSFYACYGSARCTCTSNITVTSLVGLHLFDVADYGVLKCQGITVTFTGAYVGSGATVNVHGGGVLDVVGVTWTVSVSVTGQRYNADLLGLIDSGACGSIPGTVAGFPATPGTLGTTGGLCN